MGLNIREIIPRKDIEISDLKGKILCVDAFNILYQFLSSIRQVDGTPLMDRKQRVTSHLSGIFYRNIALLEDPYSVAYHEYDPNIDDPLNKYSDKEQRAMFNSACI